VGIFSNKAKYRGPVCTKCQNISFMYWFNTGFTIHHTQWTSFCAGSQFSLLWPLPLPVSSWAYSQPGFYKPPLVFYLILSALAPKSSSTPAGGAHRHWAAIGGVATHIQKGWGHVTAHHFRTITLFYWDHFGAFLKVALGSFSCWKVNHGLSDE